MQSVTLRRGMGNRPDVDIPARIGRYEVIQKLATGGMAELYLARFEGPGGFEKRCALKRILPQFAADETFRRMFLTEARVTAMFDHPNLVQIFELGEDDAGQFYIAMELVRGRNVRQLLGLAHTQGLPIPAELAAFMAIQALDGLAYAHAFTHPDTGEPLGLVHRDISPQNILVSQAGAVKLVDFGIVKGTSISGETRSGSLKGKVAYMSPEQASGNPLDGRSDIFALGICLYEMVTGTRPFGGKNELMVLKSILERPIPPVVTYAPDCPEGVEHAIERALAKNPAHRFADARSFQTALQEILQKTPRPVTRHTLADYIRSLESDPRAFDVTYVKIPRRHSTTPSQANFPRVIGGGVHSTSEIQAPAGHFPPASSQFAESLTPQPLDERVGLSDVAAKLVPQRSYGAMAFLFTVSAMVGAGIVWSFFLLRTDAVVVEPVPDENLIEEHGAPFNPPPSTSRIKPSSEIRRPVDEPINPDTSDTPDTSDENSSPQQAERPAKTTPPARGELVLESSPKGLEVFRGRKRLGITPLEIQLSPGRHILRLADPRRGILRKISVEIEKEAVTRENIEIKKGTLKIFSRPWAEVYLDGTHQGKTPLSIEAYAGTHTLRLVSPEAGERVRQVTLEEGVEHVVPVKF